MSNYWSGKGAGSKIVIKFDKALLGDVTGNESAFTVTGYQRNPLRIGELQLKEYTVDSVERYPMSHHFKDDLRGRWMALSWRNGLVITCSTMEYRI